MSPPLPCAPTVRPPVTSFPSSEEAQHAPRSSAGFLFSTKKIALSFTAIITSRFSKIVGSKAKQTRKTMAAFNSRTIFSAIVLALASSTLSAAAQNTFTINADTDTCFMSGANTMRIQYAVEGLAIPEPGDNFVVTVQTLNADTKTPVQGVPAQTFNGKTAAGQTPSELVGTQTPEVNRVAGFLDFDLGNAANAGLKCAGGKNNLEFAILSYLQNGVAATVTNAVGAVGGAPSKAAAPAMTTAAPTTVAATTAAVTGMPTTAAMMAAMNKDPNLTPQCVMAVSNFLNTLTTNNGQVPVTTAVATTAAAATTKAITTAPATKAPTTAAGTKAPTTAAGTKAAATAAAMTTTAPGATTAAAGANVNPKPVTAMYDGQCSGNNAITLNVGLKQGGETFKPDAANPGGKVPCDEYFEISFSFVDAATGAPLNLPINQNNFFNAKKIMSDGQGNVFAQFTPEDPGFGSGFLPLSGGLTCTNGKPNFKIQTNYLLTALNDGTYNRNLNTVTDAGFFGSGKTATTPANAANLGLGMPQCNVNANTPIAFPFPAAGAANGAVKMNALGQEDAASGSQSSQSDAASSSSNIGVIAGLGIGVAAIAVAAAFVVIRKKQRGQKQAELSTPVTVSHIGDMPRDLEYNRIHT